MTAKRLQEIERIVERIIAGARRRDSEIQILCDGKPTPITECLPWEPPPYIPIMQEMIAEIKRLRSPAKVRK